METYSIASKVLLGALLLCFHMLCCAARPSFITTTATNTRPWSTAAFSEDPVTTLELPLGSSTGHGNEEQPSAPLHPPFVFLRRKLFGTVVIKEKSVAKVKENGKMVTKGDAYAIAGTGTSTTKVVSVTKIKTKKDGTTVGTTKTKGFSTSSPGGTAETGASAGTGASFGGVDLGSGVSLASAGGGQAAAEAQGTAATSECTWSIMGLN